MQKAGGADPLPTSAFCIPPSSFAGLHLHHLCNGSTLPPVVRVEQSIYRDGRRYFVKLKVAGTAMRFPCGLGEAGLEAARQRRDATKAADTRHITEARCPQERRRFQRVLAQAANHAGPVNVTQPQPAGGAA
jgi:hypothetical protein